jgi:rhombotail lipoprotein
MPTRHGVATLVQGERVSREAGVDGFTAAAAQMIDHFDSALTQFEVDVRAGTANARVVNRSGGDRASMTGGGGACRWLLALLPIVAVRVRRRHQATGFVEAVQ